MYKKSQIAVTDLLISLVIFLLLIIALVNFWNTYSKRLAQDIDYRALELKAFHITDVLTKNPGIPLTWETDPSSALVIGLQQKDGILSKNKVNSFFSLNESSIKEFLNIEAYNFYTELRALNNTPLTNSSGTSPNNPKQTIVIKRYLLYDNQKAILSFTLWN